VTEEMTAATATVGADDELAEIRAELRAVSRDLLGKVNPGTAVGWRQLADADWLGLEVPAALNGAGVTFAEVAVILQELGRAAAAGPYLGAIALGVGTLRELAPSPGRDQLLKQAASGQTLTVPVLTDGADAPWYGSGGSSASSGVPFRLERTSDGLRLHGHASFAPDAAEAGPLLLLATALPGSAPPPDSGASQDTGARQGDGAPADGATPVIVDVDPSANGLAVSAQPVLDATRRLALVTADGVQVDEASVHRFDADPTAAIGRLLDRAAVAIACDSLGLSEAMLDATVAYAGVRQQFGRPIGSFQAVKHACADMLVQISVARGLVDAATQAVAAGTPDASVAASMAKSYACAAAVEVAGKAMQLHGGIGYTWESGIHVYLKRAALNRSLFGSPTAHRKRLAARYNQTDGWRSSTIPA